MSNSPTAHETQSAGTDDSTDDPEAGSLEDLTPTLAKPIRKTSFWAAIVLPICYLPLLAMGLSNWIETTAFLLLLSTNLLALYVGHAHRRQE